MAGWLEQAAAYCSVSDLLAGEVFPEHPTDGMRIAIVYVCPPLAAGVVSLPQNMDELPIGNGRDNLPLRHSSNV